ncbi:hypothetical protein [Botrimarina mediterranea]|uniref:PEP-CTERM protein-sorting domain-containing protein n=1 Tax=Botrimarina mediterranea TaxID=2528022 RepID=A0A518K2D5_9BACT|nr:hypothetical protein [Botrimarina mediterranea]QDV71929.1 hypothetical protein Spa11_00980 [Botrimarina mediterranea]QDV76470.1 hypothetical protein K2D_00480 [Planctomycetes bacterium K2D]
MIRQLATLAACAALLTGAGTSQATMLGFGQLGGSNSTVPKNYGSNATADASGLVVTNDATPNIVVAWDVNGQENNGNPDSNGWDIHTSNFFASIEGATVGGGAWDNEGDIPRIGQLDFGLHTIGFAADPGVRLVLNSFDFGHTAETAGTTEWDLSLTDSGANVVWSQSVTFVDGSVSNIAPNFTGLPGEDYTLTFQRTSETYGSNGRHALDNLSFNQVPEPTACVLVGLIGLAHATGVRRSGLA